MNKKAGFDISGLQGLADMLGKDIQDFKKSFEENRELQALVKKNLMYTHEKNIIVNGMAVKIQLFNDRVSVLLPTEMTNKKFYDDFEINSNELDELRAYKKLPWFKKIFK